MCFRASKCILTWRFFIVKIFKIIDVMPYEKFIKRAKHIVIIIIELLYLGRNGIIKR